MANPYHAYTLDDNGKLLPRQDELEETLSIFGESDEWFETLHHPANNNSELDIDDFPSMS